MTPAMTEHYSDHATTEDKRRGMERLSFFTQDALPAAAQEPERAELHGLIDTLSIEKVRILLHTLKTQDQEPMKGYAFSMQ